MSIWKSKELAFDLDALEQLRRNTQVLRDGLNAQRDDLVKGLEVLRQNWQTDAGREFFQNLDGKWEAQVKRFDSVLRVFDRMLGQAERDYGEVQDQAERIGTEHL